MFPPQSNSPVTELAADISSTDTTVMVVAGNLLPAAPNVATIGLDELAETIYYATKNGNELSGVIRGYDGTSPKGWNAGTRIARYLTAQDISALQHNVSDHETRINGISTATINKIEPRLVDDLPALYPIGLSLFSLTLEASAPWKTAIGHSGSGQTTLVQTAKANDDQYSIVQRVTFSTASGIEAMYERSSTVNNSWNGAWIKVVSRSDFDLLSNDVTAHLADFAAHEADYVRQPAFAVTSGTSTAYTVTLDPAPASLPEGFGITIVPHVDCGDDPTLEVNGLGLVELKNQKGETFSAGEMVAGIPYSFRYVGTDFLADSGSGGGEDVSGQTEEIIEFADDIDAYDPVYVMLYMSKLPDPSTLPTSIGNGASFSPDGTYLAIVHNTSPYVTIYKRDGDTFTKLANPSTLPTSTALGASFSPDGAYLAIAHASSPYVIIYKNKPQAYKSTGNGDWLNGSKVGYAKESGSAGQSKKVVITHH
jgi:hypothetical protein